MEEISNNVSRQPLKLETAPVLSSDITKIANDHKSTFGKVSAVTGWRAFFRGEFFGQGHQTNLTASSLLSNIKSTYGENIAKKVDRQLGLNNQGSRCINSYKVAKAVALVEAEHGWTEQREKEINYTQDYEQGEALPTASKCNVTLTPLALLKSLQKNRDLFGVASTDTQNKNAVNAWVEQMQIGQKTTTSFVRSGILVPPSTGDEESASVTNGEMTAREKTGLNRYKQILSAMVETTPSLIPNDFDEKKYNETNPLGIEHAHIGLLSANDEKEAQMAKDQLDFIKNQVNDKTMEIDYVKPGTEGVIKIWVKPKVRYTNFSVQKPLNNSSSNQDAGALTQNETVSLVDQEKSQGTPDTETEETLNYYLGGNGEIEQKIQKKYPDIDSAHTNDLKSTPEWKLLEEVRKLRGDRNKEGSSFYSYEFQTKYSLLLEKCGIPTHVYCKSGKDRTSRFSEMIKMWAANPELKLEKMTRAVRNIIKAFSFSGNSEIQRLNTGFAGNKQFKTYWRLIAGEKKDRTFGGWTHLLSAAWYAPWGRVKT